MVDPNTRQGKRTPVTLKIKFKSETLEQFIERYAVDVSQGGIFIRTKEPLAVGTQMKFEFQLRDASPLIAGEGTVVWTRENDPSRPAIAPGMGVRFDRLADGSQGVLERILTEKLKQAPQRPASDTSRPPMFTDTPTRVAPVPVQEALLGKDNGKSRRGDDHNDSHTPLPKPMPFHSDADEFPDEAFEEATKVRALDELIAQTAEGTPEELTARGGRPNGRSDATVTDPVPDRAAAAEAAHLPNLPKPPGPARPQARTDSSPPPRGEPPPALLKTQLGVEPARPRVASPTPPPTAPPAPPPAPPSPPPSLGHMSSDLPPLPAGMRAVAAEETQPARMPPLRSRSIAPLLILIFLVVAAAGAAVWFLILRPQAVEPRTAVPPSGKPATAGSAAIAGGSAGTGAPRTGAPAGTNTGAPQAGGNTAPPPTSGAPKVELVETVIDTSVSGAMIEVAGTDQTGPAPLAAKLEKGKAYKARISARGYAALELDVKGGDAKQTAKLVAKPRFLSITSDPTGAQITIDGAAVGRTPAEIELSAAQAAKKSFHLVIRKAGFRLVDRTLDQSRFTEDDVKMSAKLDEKLTTAPANVPGRTGAGTGSVKQPPGPGSDTSSPAGSAAGTETTAPPTGGSGQSSGGEGAATAPAPAAPPAPAPSPPPASAPTPAPAPAPAPASGGGGGGGGSAEPEPDFNKH